MEDIAAVEMVGGTSGIPALRDVVFEVLQKQPLFTLNSEQAIAHGCALLGTLSTSYFPPINLSISDQLPYAVRIKIRQYGLVQDIDPVVVFESGSPFPIKREVSAGITPPFTIFGFEGEGSHTSRWEVTCDREIPDDFFAVQLEVKVNDDRIFVVSHAKILHGEQEKSHFELNIEQQDVLFNDGLIEQLHKLEADYEEAELARQRRPSSKQSNDNASRGINSPDLSAQISAMNVAQKTSELSNAQNQNGEYKPFVTEKQHQMERYTAEERLNNKTNDGNILKDSDINHTLNHKDDMLAQNIVISGGQKSPPSEVINDITDNTTPFYSLDLEDKLRPLTQDRIIFVKSPSNEAIPTKFLEPAENTDHFTTSLATTLDINHVQQDNSAFDRLQARPEDEKVSHMEPERKKMETMYSDVIRLEKEYLLRFRSFQNYEYALQNAEENVRDLSSRPTIADVAKLDQLKDLVRGERHWLQSASDAFANPPYKAEPSTKTEEIEQRISAFESNVDQLVCALYSQSMVSATAAESYHQGLPMKMSEVALSSDFSETEPARTPSGAQPTDAHNAEYQTAKRKLEEYVADMDVRLPSKLHWFATDKERETIYQLLTQSKQLTRYPGSAATAHDFNEKWIGIKQIGDRVERREAEYRVRETACTEFQRSMQNLSKEIEESLSTSTGPHSNLPKSQLQSVLQLVAQEQQWLTHKTTQIYGSSLTDDDITGTLEITSRHQAFRSKSESILHPLATNKDANQSSDGSIVIDYTHSDAFEAFEKALLDVCAGVDHITDEGSLYGQLNASQLSELRTLLDSNRQWLLAITDSGRRSGGKNSNLAELKSVHKAFNSACRRIINQSKSNALPVFHVKHAHGSGKKREITPEEWLYSREVSSFEQSLTAVSQWLEEIRTNVRPTFKGVSANAKLLELRERITKDRSWLGNMSTKRKQDYQKQADSVAEKHRAFKSFCQPIIHDHDDVAQTSDSHSIYHAELLPSKSENTAEETPQMPSKEPLKPVYASDLPTESKWKPAPTPVPDSPTIVTAATADEGSGDETYREVAIDSLKETCAKITRLLDDKNWRKQYPGRISRNDLYTINRSINATREWVKNQAEFQRVFPKKTTKMSPASTNEIQEKRQQLLDTCAPVLEFYEASRTPVSFQKQERARSVPSGRRSSSFLISWQRTPMQDFSREMSPHSMRCKAASPAVITRPKVSAAAPLLTSVMTYTEQSNGDRQSSPRSSSLASLNQTPITPLTSVNGPTDSNEDVFQDLSKTYQKVKHLLNDKLKRKEFYEPLKKSMKYAITEAVVAEGKWIARNQVGQIDLGEVKSRLNFIETIFYADDYLTNGQTYPHEVYLKAVFLTICSPLLESDKAASTKHISKSRSTTPNMRASTETLQSYASQMSGWMPKPINNQKPVFQKVSDISGAPRVLSTSLVQSQEKQDGERKRATTPRILSQRQSLFLDMENTLQELSGMIEKRDGRSWKSQPDLSITQESELKELYKQLKWYFGFINRPDVTTATEEIKTVYQKLKTEQKEIVSV